MKPLNGTTSWVETHHEVVSKIAEEISKDQPTGKVEEIHSAYGLGGLYELGEQLTDEFEVLHREHEWDGDFFDTIDEWLNEKLY